MNACPRNTNIIMKIHLNHGYFQYQEKKRYFEKFEILFIEGQKGKKVNSNNAFVLITFRIIFQIKSSFLLGFPAGYLSFLREKKRNLFWKIRNFETPFIEIIVSPKKKSEKFFKNFAKEESSFQSEMFSLFWEKKEFILKNSKFLPIEKKRKAWSQIFSDRRLLHKQWEPLHRVPLKGMRVTDFCQSTA